MNLEQVRQILYPNIWLRKEKISWSDENF